MDLILFDADFHEIGPATLEIDVEVGDSSASNDFELSTVLSDFSGFYIRHGSRRHCRISCKRIQ